MRPFLVGVTFLAFVAPAAAQAPGKFPPDSLVNVKVFPKNTPVPQVVGAIRIARGPNLAPGREETPSSNGAPTIATWAPAARRVSSSVAQGSFSNEPCPST